MMKNLRSRPIESDEDAQRVFQFLVALYFEVRRVEGDPNKAFVEVYHSVKNDAVFVVEDMDKDEQIVGSVCVFDSPGGFFYAKAGGFFDEKWLYVDPQYRDGPVLRLLMNEVKDLCDRVGQPAFLRIFNPKRVQSDSPVARVGEDLGYTPAGAVVRVQPRKAS